MLSSYVDHLIQKDFNDLKKTCSEEVEGIQVDFISPDNIYEWIIKMKGEQQSIWADGVFILILKFTDQYNDIPPDVFFYTVPFHPNVDPISGWVDHELIFTQAWNDCRSILKLLSTLQDLLCNPILENNILNEEAKEMFINSPHTYNQIIADCIRHSQQIEFDLSPLIRRAYKPPKQSAKKMPITQKQIRQFNKVSFEDYHFTWSDIATCKAKQNFENSYLESLKKNSRLYEMHTGKKLKEGQQQEMSPEEEEELSVLMYGNFKPTKLKDNKNERLENVRKMKNLYMQTFSDKKITNPEKKGSGPFEPNDNEVNDLLKWLSNLDSDIIDNH